MFIILLLFISDVPDFLLVWFPFCLKKCLQFFCVGSVNSLSTSSEDTFLSPWSPKDIFAGYKLLCWQFSFSILKMLLYILLASMISGEKSTVFQIFVFLEVICYFGGWFSRFFPLFLVFNGLGLMCPDVDFCVFIFWGVFRASWMYRFVFFCQT